MTAEFAGKTALITGAGRGIGAAIATGLSRAGSDVVLLARTAEQLRATASSIRAAVPGAEVHVVLADLTDDEQRLAAIGDIRSSGHVDVLVNNAATVEPLGPSWKINPHDLRRAFETNVVAPFALAGDLTAGMVDAGWGRIVNVSSNVVADPALMIHGNAYATTKAALEAHSRNLAAELEGTGVTVNVFRPGRVDTAMQSWVRRQDPERIGSGLRDSFVARYDSGDLISPEDSAAALLSHLLGTDGSRTGAIWAVGDTVC